MVRITSGYRTSKAIHHVVTSIVAPFGEPVENRPPVLSQAELDELRVKKRLLKDVRSAEKGRDVSVRRVALAKRQGIPIPTLEEAMAGLKVHEGTEKSRNQAHGGQSGQAKTAKERRLDQGKKTKAEVRVESEVKEARIQTA